LGFRFGIYDLQLGIRGKESDARSEVFRILGFGFWVLGFGFRVQGLGFGAALGFGI